MGRSRDRCIRWGGYRQRGRSSFWGEFGATHCNLWDLLRSCEEVCKPIDLSFGVVSGVIPSIHVLDGGPRASRGRVDFGVVCPIGSMVSMAYFVTEMYLTRA